ncbi:MAG: ATP-binding protein [Micavibrio sp.]|nr:ATP-binding protein [Micavibrio sp.]
MAQGIFKKIKSALLPRTLFGRSLMIVAMPILLMQMIVAFIFFDRHWDAMSDKLVFALAGEISMVTERVIETNNIALQTEITRQASHSLDLTVFVDNDAADLQRMELSFEKFSWFSVAQKLKAVLADRLEKKFTIRPYEKDKQFEIVVAIGPKKTVHFICPDRRIYSPTTYIFVLWMIGSAVLLLGIAMAFMRNQIRPIMRLAVAAEKFGKGQDVPDFRPVGAHEVRQASIAFLLMRDRLRRQMEQRTAMLSGVSHDLRTPLTRMKLEIAMLKPSPEIENLRQDVEEMERMLEGYLTFAKGESDEMVEMIDLKSVLERIVAKARRQGAEVQEVLPEQRMMIRLRPVAIERALGNIVTNAGKFAKNTWVTATEQADVYEITIDDDGPGIAQNLREDVFKPFFRIEKSRNKKTGGIGLGLSIAQDIVHSHGGEIFLEASNRNGLRVVIRLPK